MSVLDMLDSSDNPWERLVRAGALFNQQLFAFKSKTAFWDCCHSCMPSICKSICGLIILSRWHTGIASATIRTPSLSGARRGIGRRALQLQLVIEKWCSAAEVTISPARSSQITNVSLPGMHMQLGRCVRIYRCRDGAHCLPFNSVKNGNEWQQ